MDQGDRVPVLDGSTQETFNQSIGGFLADLLNDWKRVANWHHVHCLLCGQVHDVAVSGPFWRCAGCGHDAGELRPDEKPVRQIGGIHGSE